MLIVKCTKHLDVLSVSGHETQDDPEGLVHWKTFSSVIFIQMI